MQKRLESMGIECKPMQGERSVLARIRLQSQSFEGLDGPVRIEQVLFATVGQDRIKCLKPRELFNLPLIKVLDCRESTAIEARIRLAWSRRIAALREARDWLESIGAHPAADDGGTALTLPIEGEKRPARAYLLDGRDVILPGQGPLSGIALERPEDRLLHVDRSARSSVELEIAVSSRLEELSRLDRRLSDERRLEQGAGGEDERPVDVRERRRVQLLLVGPRISQERQVSESLRLRGYDVISAANPAEGLRVFNRCSPELVLADLQMGRSEGTEFVLDLRQVTGIEEVPVVLLDAARREQSREAARRVGAAGYVIYPVDVPRIADRLDKMVNEPRRRRYTRFARRLPITIEGARMPCLVTSLGRGGMFVTTDDSIATRTMRRCELTLPELAASVSCEGEVIYRRGNQGRQRGGVGMRFHHFANAGEDLLIDYLKTIAGAREMEA